LFRRRELPRGTFTTAMHFALLELSIIETAVLALLASKG